MTGSFEPVKREKSGDLFTATEQAMMNDELIAIWQRW
jgi:hypothetical protein